jgi:hypothetical protein
MPTGYTRLALETFPGNEVNTPTLSTKKLFPPLQSLQPTRGEAPLNRDDEMRNTDEPLAITPESYSPTWEMNVRAYPDTMAFLLALTLGAPTTTAGNGVITDLGGGTIPTGAFRHRFTAPFGPAGAYPNTAQGDIAYSDQGVYLKGKGLAVSDLSLDTPEQGGAAVKVNGPGLFLDEQSNPSLTPAFEALSIPPFFRGNLTLPSNLAGTGVTQDFGLAISNPVEPARTLGIPSLYPDTMFKANSGGPIVVSGTIPKQILDSQDLQALKAATGFELLASWVSTAVIASGYPYKMFFKAANAQYTDGTPEALQNKRRLGASFGWKSTTTSSGSSTFEIVNATASYA